LNIGNNKSDIFEHIKNLDYPRLSGTEGAKRAANYISKVFEKYGYKPIREKFRYAPPSTIRSFVVIILFSSLLIISLLNLAYFKSIIISILFLAVPVLIIVGILRINAIFKNMIKRKMNQFSKIDKLESKKNSPNKKFRHCENIIAEYNPPNYKKHLYIACHYDSISLKLSTKTIIISSIIGGLSFIAYFLIYLIDFILSLFNFDLFETYGYIFYILFASSVTFINILLIGRTFRSNLSHGALDDGTGVAIILELSKIIKKINPRLRVTFVTFGSEEVGFYGSCYHFYKNQKDFNPDLQMISIDMIGEVPPLCFVETINPIMKIKTEKNFNQELVAIAKNNNINLKGINFLYPGSDFAVWLLNDYRANWIYTKSKFIHSKKDNPSKVNKKLLTECFTLFVEYFKKYV